MTGEKNLTKISTESAEEFKVFIEIPKNSNIKYEYDPDSGFIMVDRKLFTAMYYPCNYGFIPNTLELDGDPTDILVLGDSAFVPMSLINARPVGVLYTEDEEGQDSKIIGVPVSKIDPVFDHVNDISDIPQYLLDQINHFFEHYKELERGKYVKVSGWGSKVNAIQKISESIERFNKKNK